MGEGRGQGKTPCYFNVFSIFYPASCYLNACNRVSYFLLLLFCFRAVEEETTLNNNKNQEIMYWMVFLKFSNLRARITEYFAPTNIKLFIRKTHDKFTLS